MQIRVETGKAFEREIESEFNFDSPKKHGFKKTPLSYWTVKGRNFIEKIKNSGFDPAKFNLDKKKSRFYKADQAFLENGLSKKVEDKKYFVLRNTFMLAEPVLSVKRKENIPQFEKIWGVCEDCAREKYNEFITKFFNTRQDILDYIIEEFKKNSDYIIGKEKVLVPIEKFKLTAKLGSGWRGFKRIRITAKYIG